jgi:hypothetical protein
MERQRGNNSMMDDFLNPKSMLTPGIAGGIVMLITNTVCLQFPELTPRWLGLLLSFLLGLLVFMAGSIPKWQASLYYLLNSLIIFSVAMGTANTASRIVRRIYKKKTFQHYGYGCVHCACTTS